MHVSYVGYIVTAAAPLVILWLMATGRFRSAEIVLVLLVLPMLVAIVAEDHGVAFIRFEENNDPAADNR